MENLLPLISCTSCNNLFAENNGYSPLVLDCGHTLCQFCINSESSKLLTKYGEIIFKMKCERDSC